MIKKLKKPCWVIVCDVCKKNEIEDSGFSPHSLTREMAGEAEKIYKNDMGSAKVYCKDCCNK